jgi:hypothetical protein
MECENQIQQQLECFDAKIALQQVLEQNGALKTRSAQVCLELQRRQNGLGYELLEERKALLFLAQTLPG